MICSGCGYPDDEPEDGYSSCCNEPMTDRPTPRDRLEFTL